MSARGITRRGLLGATAAGAAAFSLPRIFERAAVANGQDRPLNFICLYHPHGISAEFWAMRGSDTETAFDIAYDKCSLQPFVDAATYGKSFKDKILVVEGVDHLSSVNGHDSAGTILTGSRIDSGALKPQNSSLDQYLAVEQGLGSATRITSVPSLRCLRGGSGLRLVRCVPCRSMAGRPRSRSRPRAGIRR